MSCVLAPHRVYQVACKIRRNSVMPGRSTLLGNYPVVRSSDPEFVRDRLFSVYGATGFEIGNDASAFAVDANHLQVGDLGLSYCDYASDVSVGFGEASFIRQFFALEGAARYTAGRHTGEMTAKSCTPILPAREPLQLDFRGGYRQLVLRVEFDSLSRNLGALVGQHVDNLEFDRSAANQPAMEALRRRIFHFANDFNDRGSFFSEITAAEVERMVMMEFLICHRHNYTHLLLREPVSASFPAVKAVEEYIEANWQKPIAIETMVEIAGVSARSLFRQFRKSRAYSPADFAKRIRLKRAREMLEQPNPNDTVIAIALRCGFQSLGRFARDYNGMFGELPSTTLQSAKKWLS